MQSINEVNCFNDLKQFGINPLTGESCKLNLRMLCDLNEQGAETMENYLGTTITRGNNWNNKVNGKDSVASIMISRMDLLTVATFAMIYHGYWMVYSDKKCSLGFISQEVYDKCKSYKDFIDKSDEGVKFFNKNNNHSIGTRNIHQITGRVA